MTTSIKRFLFLNAAVLLVISSASLASPFDEGNTKTEMFYSENCSSCLTPCFLMEGGYIYNEDLRKLIFKSFIFDG